MTPITGSTVTVGVIGSPVRHSLSPTLHNAAFEAMGVDARSLAFPVAEGDAAAAVDAMRTLGLRGLSVTMPHKEAVLAAADHRSEAAERLGAANCLVNDDGVVTAHNTDGDGFVRSLEHESGLDVSGRRVAVIGAGGAARSVIEAVARAGAAEVTVINRTVSRAETASALAGSVGRIGTDADLGAADIVVNATSLGMDGAGMPCAPDLLRSEQVVVDLVYRPLETPWLAAAAEIGASALNGVPMLLHQAAVQLEIWTGSPAPIDAMRASVAAQMNLT